MVLRCACLWAALLACDALRISPSTAANVSASADCGGDTTVLAARLGARGYWKGQGFCSALLSGSGIGGSVASPLNLLRGACAAGVAGARPLCAISAKECDTGGYMGTSADAAFATDGSMYTAAHVTAGPSGTYLVAGLRAPSAALAHVCLKGKFGANTTLSVTSVSGGGGVSSATSTVALRALPSGTSIDECFALGQEAQVALAGRLVTSLRVDAGCVGGASHANSTHACEAGETFSLTAISAFAVGGGGGGGGGGDAAAAATCPETLTFDLGAHFSLSSVRLQAYKAGMASVDVLLSSARAAAPGGPPPPPPSFTALARNASFDRSAAQFWLQLDEGVPASLASERVRFVRFVFHVRAGHRATLVEVTVEGTPVAAPAAATATAVAADDGAGEECAPGWYGTGCTLAMPCANDCWSGAGRGSCHAANGTCACAPNVFGADCSCANARVKLPAGHGFARLSSGGGSVVTTNHVMDDVTAAAQAGAQQLVLEGGASSRPLWQSAGVCSAFTGRSLNVSALNALLGACGAGLCTASCECPQSRQTAAAARTAYSCSAQTRADTAAAFPGLDVGALASGVMEAATDGNAAYTATTVKYSSAERRAWFEAALPQPAALRAVWLRATLGNRDPAASVFRLSVVTAAGSVHALSDAPPEYVRSLLTRAFSFFYLLTTPTLLVSRSLFYACL